MIRRAIGAAVCAPKPACSTTTATTYWRLSGVPPNIADEQRRVTLARHLRGAGLARDRDLRRAGSPGTPGTRCPAGLAWIPRPGSRRASRRASSDRRRRGGSAFGCTVAMTLPLGFVDLVLDVRAATTCRRWRTPRTRSASCSGVTDEVALADREEDVVVRVPRAVLAAWPPRSCSWRSRTPHFHAGSGTRPCRLVELEAGRGAEAELARLASGCRARASCRRPSRRFQNVSPTV